MVAQAHGRDSMQALSKRTTVVDGERRIVSNAPIIEPIEEVLTRRRHHLPARLYRHRRWRSLQSDRRPVGAVPPGPGGEGGGCRSVGLRAWIVLMDATARSRSLQAKEAQPSVLADYCGHSRYAHEGERSSPGST
jgi:hypothetical protein